MIQTIEAIIDVNGKVVLQETVKLNKTFRALVTILDEDPKNEILETAILSEVSLAKDWNTAEENEAWQHLAELPSC
jgi:hypothetical protein